VLPYQEDHMLVLTRKLGEAVCIGKEVEVFVLGVSRGRVKLGFRAPRNVAVQRPEAASRAATTAAESHASPAVPARRNRDEFALTPPLRQFREMAGV
jgi:carbon storage regulator